ncbi:hypothetical protein HMPREF1531_00061 [Propionibacterium sp. oral taxon 192 str. F0372]|uniref:AI-2E family transporter n=1 Tax=Propionibacterium sp. oral taxon 192 TaxID=671222 RepID=UPI0003547D32|nr:AI-2E family transporter [Propionibacterium sp. oral taxon 192]EPH07016.1 hypothetical protein HMPREF1531_00061 [Propionibacterium sp. oral taxon 192 str. F0372]
MSDIFVPESHSWVPRPRFNTVMIGLAACLVLLFALREFASVIGPTFLALNLMITIYPMHTWMVRKGTPSWLSAVIITLSVYAILLAIVIGMIWSITEMIDILPRYASQFSVMYQQVIDLSARLGLDSSAFNQFISTFDPSRLLGAATTAATSLLTGASGTVGVITVILAAIIFMAMDTPAMERRLRLLEEERPRMLEGFLIFARGVRRYWAVTTIFGLIVAILDGIAVAAMGVPLALVWALFSFLTNYIPNIGFVIGLVPPALVALFANGWQTAVAVIVIYSVLNFVVQSIIQPRFTGESVGITPTISFISLLLWTGVIGALGTLLALPLTLLCKSLLVDIDPDAKWIDSMISSDLKGMEAEAEGLRD